MMPTGQGVPRAAHREGERSRRQDPREVPARPGRSREEEIKAALRKRTIESVRNEKTPRSCPSSAARRSRTRASSRCSTPSSTSCRRRSRFPSVTGIDPNGAEGATTERPAKDDAPLVGAGVQDHDRPVRRSAHVHPRLLGRHDVRAWRSTTRPSRRPSASAACSRCTRTSARKSRKSTPATSPPRSG